MENKAFEMIAKQLENEPERSMLRMLAEQLKDIIASTQGAGELVAQDLENEQMSLAALKKVFDDFAQKHKSGGCAIITPQEADTLIRTFYGIGERETPATVAPKPAEKPKLSLLDFL